MIPALIVPWASLETNYPAGANPWNGQPLKLPPAGDYWTPNTHPAPEEHNYVLNLMGAAIAGCQVAGVGAWNAPVSAQTLTSDAAAQSGAAAYDPLNGRWLVATVQTSLQNLRVWTSYDGNDPWIDVGGGTAWAFPSVTTGLLAVCQDPTDPTTIWATGIYGTGVNFQTVKNVAGTYSSVAGASQTGVSGLTDVQLLTFNGYIILAYGSSAISPDLWSSNNGFSSKTVAGLGGTIQHWILKQNGSLAIAAPAYGVPGGGGTWPRIYTTPDGHTWTQQTASLGSLMGASDTITGLDWGADAGGACWLLNVLLAAGGTKTLRSADGINWTLAGTTATSISYALCALGNTWYSVLTPDVQSVKRIAVSPNGGVNWYQTPAIMAPAGGAGNNPVILGSPSQALALSSFDVRTSAARDLGAAVT